ncbi:MAG: hypothetical protein C0514_04160 [Candidatus Puniceispirillum sp.]|nr:hypothetical protein [Candidatus Puniceispirillum sp.]
MFLALHKNKLQTFLVAGLMLFSLSVVHTVLNTTKLSVLMDDLPGSIQGAKEYVIYVQCSLFAIFALLYRKKYFPHLMFGSVLVLLGAFVVFHLGVAQPPRQAAYGYFVMAQLWGPLSMSFLFWAVANQTFSWQDAKWAYPLLTLFASLAVVLTTLFIGGLTSLRHQESAQLFLTQTGYVLLGALILFAIAAWWAKGLGLHKGNVPEEVSFAPHTAAALVQPALIFLITLSMGVCTRLLDTLLKLQLRLHEGVQALSYMYFMEMYGYATGGVGVILFVSTFWIIWRCGWFKGALVAPLFTALSSVGILICAQTATAQGVLDFDNMPVLLAVIALQSMILKGLYVLFFATKEMAYIPMDGAMRVRAKLVIDFLCAGLALLLSNFVGQKIFTHLAHGQTQMFLGVIVMVSLVWVGSVFGLAKILPHQKKPNA